MSLDQINKETRQLAKIIGEQFTKYKTAPSQFVGTIWFWDRTDVIPDHLLALDGSVHANVDVDYPELWAVRDKTTLIAAFDDTAKTITLQNYNGEGRFLRGGASAGTKQEDATAVNGLSMSEETRPANYWSEVTSGSSTLYGNYTNGYTLRHKHTLSGDAETRPINVSTVLCVIAKPFMTTGDVTVNQLIEGDTINKVYQFDATGKSNGSTIALSGSKDMFSNGYSIGGYSVKCLNASGYWLDINSFDADNNWLLKSEIRGGNTSTDSSLYVYQFGNVSKSRLHRINVTWVKATTIIEL